MIMVMIMRMRMGMGMVQQGVGLVLATRSMVIKGVIMEIVIKLNF